MVNNNAECIRYIRGHLSDGEQLAGLAEESAELAKAALKLRRCIDGSNPTPVTEREEVADVLLCLKVLGFPVDPDCYSVNMDSKLERWVERLKEKYGE